MGLPSFGPWPDYRDRTTFEERIAYNFPLIEPWGEAVDALAEQIDEDATNISQDKAIITNLKNEAQSLINFKGEWTSLSGVLNKDASVSHNGLIYRLRNNLTNVELSEPGVSSDWTIVSGTGDRFEALARFRKRTRLLYMPLRNSLEMFPGNGPAVFTRDCAATYIDRYGVVHDLAANEPGFDEDGIDLPCASTNLLINSDQMWLWGSVRVNVLQETTIKASDRIRDCTKVEVASDGNGDDYIERSAIPTSKTVGSPYTFSVDVKKGNDQYVTIRLIALGASNSIVEYIFDFDNESLTQFVDNSSTQTAWKKLVDGWYRIEISIAAVSETTSVLVRVHPYSRAIGKSVGTYCYMSKGQMEELPFATPPIYTEDTLVARLGSTLEFPYQNNFPGSLADKMVALDVNVIGTSNTFDLLFTSGDLRIHASRGTANDGRTLIQMDDALSYTPEVPYTMGQVLRWGVTYDASATTLRHYLEQNMVAETISAISTTPALSKIEIGGQGTYTKVKELVIYDSCPDELEMEVAS